MKFRLTITVAREYEVDLSCYPENSTTDEMLKIDKEAIVDDPGIMLDHPGAKWDIQVIEL